MVWLAAVQSAALISRLIVIICGVLIKQPFAFGLGGSLRGIHHRRINNADIRSACSSLFVHESGGKKYAGR